MNDNLLAEIELFGAMRATLLEVRAEARATIKRSQNVQAAAQRARRDAQVIKARIDRRRATERPARP